MAMMKTVLHQLKEEHSAVLKGLDEVEAAVLQLQTVTEEQYLSDSDRYDAESKALKTRAIELHERALLVSMKIDILNSLIKGGAH